LSCLCFCTSGAFAVDSSALALTGDLNEHSILLVTCYRLFVQ
jgi:hypothetical protein